MAIDNPASPNSDGGYLLTPQPRTRPPTARPVQQPLSSPVVDCSLVLVQ